MWFMIFSQIWYNCMVRKVWNIVSLFGILWKLFLCVKYS